MRYVSPTSNYLSSSYKWSIPLTFFSSESTTVERELFEYTHEKLTITTTADTEWIKFNKDQVGFYRVNYPQDTWIALSEALIKDVNVSVRQYSM